MASSTVLHFKWFSSGISWATEALGESIADSSVDLKVEKAKANTEFFIAYD